MKLDETKLQEVVEKIAYQQFGQEQIDDLYAKMGILNDYVQEQLRLFAVVERSEQLLCPICSSENVDAEFNHYNFCRDCNHDWAK
jgi:hypothetical protein